RVSIGGEQSRMGGPASDNASAGKNDFGSGDDPAVARPPVKSRAKLSNVVRDGADNSGVCDEREFRPDSLMLRSGGDSKSGALHLVGDVGLLGRGGEGSNEKENEEQEVGFHPKVNCHSAFCVSIANTEVFEKSFKKSF